MDTETLEELLDRVGERYPRLPSLNLSGNALFGELPRSALNGLATLIRLDLSNNQLGPTLNLHLYTALPQLTTLLLSCNRFEDIGSGGAVLGRLARLDLGSNPLRREGDVLATLRAGAPVLAHLVLDATPLCTLPSYREACARSFPGLRTLDGAVLVARGTGGSSQVTLRLMRSGHQERPPAFSPAGDFAPSAPPLQRPVLNTAATTLAVEVASRPSQTLAAGANRAVEPMSTGSASPSFREKLHPGDKVVNNNAPSQIARLRLEAATANIFADQQAHSAEVSRVAARTARAQVEALTQEVVRLRGELAATVAAATAAREAASCAERNTATSEARAEAAEQLALAQERFVLTADEADQKVAKCSGSKQLGQLLAGWRTRVFELLVERRLTAARCSQLAKERDLEWERANRAEKAREQYRERMLKSQRDVAERIEVIEERCIANAQAAAAGVAAAVVVASKHLEGEAAAHERRLKAAGAALAHAESRVSRASATVAHVVSALRRRRSDESSKERELEQARSLLRAKAAKACQANERAVASDAAAAAARAQYTQLERAHAELRQRSASESITSSALRDKQARAAEAAAQVKIDAALSEAATARREQARLGVELRQAQRELAKLGVEVRKERDAKVLYLEERLKRKEHEAHNLRRERNALLSALRQHEGSIKRAKDADGPSETI